MPAPQLSLFEADRYHDPRVAAERARARAIAKLRPVRRCERGEVDDEAGARGIDAPRTDSVPVAA